MQAPKAGAFILLERCERKCKSSTAARKQAASSHSRHTATSRQLGASTARQQRGGRLEQHKACAFQHSHAAWATRANRTVLKACTKRGKAVHAGVGQSQLKRTRTRLPLGDEVLVPSPSSTPSATAGARPPSSCFSAMGSTHSRCMPRASQQNRCLVGGTGFVMKSAAIAADGT